MFLDPRVAEGGAATRSAESGAGTRFKSTLSDSEHVQHVAVDGLTLPFSGTDATANDDVLLLTIENAGDFRHFTFQADAGAADVEVTVDGTNWTAAVPLRNTAGVVLASDEINAAAPGTRVGHLSGVFAGVRVRKKGVTNPTTVRAIAGR